MPEVHFRVDGLTEENVRRWRKRTRPTAISATVLLWTAASAIVIYAVGSLTPGALIDGKEIRGRSVLVMQDISGSMRGTEQTLGTHIAGLKASGMLMKGRNVHGFGVSTTGDRNNLLKQLEEGLRADPNVDAVYVFSDFHYYDKPIDGSNAAGYERLRQLLRGHGVQLYLGVVRRQPPKELIEIAKESGGDVIESK